MNRYNSQLPEVPAPKPQTTNWFSQHHMWGYAFLFLAFLLTVALIYQYEYGKQVKETQFCVQVVASAKNQQTGEIKEFPTPCDVPKGWTTVNPTIQEGNNLQME